MFVFDPVTAASLLVLASAQPQACPQPPPVAINVTPKTDGIDYDYKQSMTTIQSVKTDTPDPYGIHSASVTQGFMEGQISFKRSAELDHKIINRQGDVCLWYKNIDITIEIDPKIVIAREIQKDRCMAAAVMAHEKKHINVDRKVVNEAAKNIGDKIYAAIKAQNFVVGPVPYDQAEAQATAMLAEIAAIADAEFKAMGAKRNADQSAVDTREEYDRVSAMCPDFHKRQQALYQRALVAKDLNNKEKSK